MYILHIARYMYVYNVWVKQFYVNKVIEFFNLQNYTLYFFLLKNPIETYVTCTENAVRMYPHLDKNIIVHCCFYILIQYCL